jgi:hypothetical protein
VLFEDPARRSTSVGVTVSPVRVASIEQFGDLEAVGKRLLDAERKKVRFKLSVMLGPALEPRCSMRLDRQCMHNSSSSSSCIFASCLCTALDAAQKSTTAAACHLLS